jgi:DNA-binding MarR family transcriptional regulator
MKQRSPQGTALTGLILETTSEFGLSSARWQVMGAIEEAPLPVAQIARNMGLTRQAVQRVANVLADEGLTEFAENPDHRRAKLVSLTVAGRAVLEKINRRQIEWSNRLAEEQDPAEIEAALGVMQSFHRRLQAEKQ